jgi:hypothetical protein
MNYVALMRFHSSLIEVDRHTALERRADTRYPDGVSILAEYWPIGGMFDVVSIISATKVTPVMELVAEWSQHFDINIRPAVAADEIQAAQPKELLGHIRSGPLRLSDNSDLFNGHSL